MVDKPRCHVVKMFFQAAWTQFWKVYKMEARKEHKDSVNDNCYNIGDSLAH